MDKINSSKKKSRIIASILLIIFFLLSLGPAIAFLNKSKILEPHNLFEKIRNYSIEFIPALTIFPGIMLLGIYLVLNIAKSISHNFRVKYNGRLFQEKFIDSFYFGGLRAFSFSVIFFVTGIWLEFITNRCNLYLFFMKPFEKNIAQFIFALLVLFPIFFFYGMFSRYIDDQHEGIKKKKKGDQHLKIRGIPEKFQRLFNEQPILSIYERISRFSLFLLPVLYLYSNHNLLYPFDEFVLWFVSIFLIFNLSLTALLFISIPDLAFRDLLSLISFRYEMTFAIINIDTYLFKKSLPNVVYLKHFLLIYLLVCVWAILGGYKSFFLKNKEKTVKPVHYSFLGGLMLGGGIALLFKNIDLLNTLNLHLSLKILFPKIEILSKIFAYFVISISAIMVSFAVIKKGKEFFSKREAIYLITIFIIFLLSLGYFINFNPVTKIDYLAILIILPIPAVCLISLRRLSLIQVFIIRMLYLLLYFCFALVYFGILSVSQMKTVFLRSVDTLLDQSLVILFTIILTIILQNKFKKK